MFLKFLLFSFQCCHPAVLPKSRDRRQLYPVYGGEGIAGDDSFLMKELWDQPVGLGFFVNPKGPPDSEGNLLSLLFEIFFFFFYNIRMLRICKYSR